MEDCGICLDPFNKKLRKRIQCAYCSGAYCKTCIQTYLLDDSATESRCPNPECRLGWSDDFLSETMTKAWLLNDYKKHREKILIDLERVRLPETQEDAGRYIRAKAFVEPISKQIQDLRKQLDSLPEQARLNLAYRNYYSLNRNRPEYQTMMEEIKTASDALKQVQRPLISQIRNLTTTEYNRNKLLVDAFGVQRVRGPRTAEQPRNAWTFVMKCPVTGCEGFVGMNWKCGLCEKEVCKECREQKVGEEEHACDPEKILTAQAIQKEAKPCPKCAAQISKIDGCDQMWCTQCQTAFSWRTGEIEQSRVHNPHYFEWMRRNAGGAPAPPAPENVECLQPNEIIDHVIHYNRTNTELLNWCRNLRHFQFILRGEQRHLERNVTNDKKKHDLRVQKLAGEIDDGKWKVALQRIEKAQKKTQRVIEVLQLYCQAGIDILRSSLLEDSDKRAICNQLVQLQGYCITEFEKIRSRFNNQVPNLVLPTYL